MKIFVLIAAVTCSGCVSFGYRRATRESPPSKTALAGLHPGETSLADSLAQLGAPLYVWEYKGDGAALAWGWYRRGDLGFTISVPLARQLSARGSYESIDENLRGFVLLFDADLKLELMREGYLRDLQNDLRRKRPAAEDSGG